MKRLFDLFISVLGLILISPLLLIVAIWIKLDSNGPIFYKQFRVGLNDVDFKLYKFRTMYINSDKKGLITVGNRDPRITNSGYFLRKYKMDELPQLINVMLGNMSLVGPRPEVRKYVNLYTKEQKKVLSVKPGITDLASIKYSDENELLGSVDDSEKYYINTVLPDKLKINLDYIDNNTLLSDIKIIWLTIKKIL